MDSSVTITEHGRQACPLPGTLRIPDIQIFTNRIAVNLHALCCLENSTLPLPVLFTAPGLLCSIRLPPGGKEVKRQLIIHTLHLSGAYNGAQLQIRDSGPNSQLDHVKEAIAIAALLSNSIYGANLQGFLEQCPQDTFW